MRSGTVRWLTGRSEPRGSPRTTSREVPRPVMSAPIATNISHRSTTSGSRRRVVDRRLPVGEDRSGDDVLGGADAREAEDDVGAMQPLGGRVDLTVAELELGAHLLQRGHVHVDRPGAEVVAARHRQPDPPATGEQRPEHVDRSPDPLDLFVRRDRREVALVRQREPTGSWRRRADPDRAEQLAHAGDVHDRRHVGQLVRAVGEDRGGHQLEDGVLRPGHVDRAPELADPADDDLIGRGIHGRRG